ncbi:MAG: iron ABC transporter permease [Propionibacteriaceae bacterium]|nr:iron ABC transporter permease [Propionibacteriaceae bacterium]
MTGVPLSAEAGVTSAPAFARATITRRSGVLVGLTAATLVLALLAVVSGSVALDPVDALRVLVGLEAHDPRVELLVGTVRLPRMTTALCAGAALGVAGLQMQTIFRNPLADPFSLGVSSGASLGVALLITGAGVAVSGSFAAGLGLLGRFGTVSAAALGSAAVLAVLLVLSRGVRVPATLLIIGVMLGSAVTAMVSLLLIWTDPLRAQQYISWGLGSFGGTTNQDLVILVGFTVLGVVVALLSIKPLNALLLGEAYAESVGVNVRRVRVVVLVGASLLTGVVTAFCGPIGFIGIAAPHVARRLIGTSDHRSLLPAAALVGACAALGCSIVSLLPGQVIPINVITSLIGAPIVVAILLRSKSIQGVSA